MKTFTNGLSIILPTAIMLFILLWVLEKTESLFKNIIMIFLPEEYYFVGMGIVSGLLFVYITGMLLKVWIFRRVQRLLEKLINKTPILNSLYGGIKDFFNFTSNMKKAKDNIIVLVDIPALDGKIMGFVTVKEFKNFDNIDLEEYVLVYFQMSYQVGGYSLFIPKKNITPLDMKIEDAMRFTLTAGVSTNKENKENKNEIS